MQRIYANATTGLCILAKWSLNGDGWQSAADGEKKPALGKLLRAQANVKGFYKLSLKISVPNLN